MERFELKCTDQKLKDVKFETRTISVDFTCDICGWSPVGNLTIE